MIFFIYAIWYKSNPIQCNEFSRAQVILYADCPHLDEKTFIYKLVAVRSALKSNKTSWLDQRLSSLFLKVLIVSLSTTSSDRLFHLLTILVQNANFLKL